MFTHNLFPRIGVLTLALGVSPVLAQESSFQPEPAKIQLIAADSTRQMPERVDAPFELRNNLIYVTAELNGKARKFLVDSGAPAFALNADQLDPAQLKDSPISVRGVGGSLRTKSFHVDSFNWQGLKLNNFDTLAFPSPARVTNKNDEPVGTIGYQVLKDYEVTFDYGRKTITLIRTDEQGNPVKKLSAKTAGVKVVPLKMYRHIPAFPLTIDGRTYQMGLDSGAGGSMLDLGHALGLRKYILLDESKRPVQAKLGGVGDNLVVSEVIVVDKATVGQAPYTNMPFVFTEGTFAQLNRGQKVKVDGLVGYDFLKQYVTSVNYKKGTITIYTQGI